MRCVCAILSSVACPNLHYCSHYFTNSTTFEIKSLNIKFGFLRGNKRPTRCNRFFYCKTYCSLNVFRAPLCLSSGAQELYRWLLLVVFGALVNRSLVWCGAVGYVFAGCCSSSILQTWHITQVPQAATICITLELLMMGIMVPEKCWANSKFCNKNTNLLRLVGLLFPRINDDARSNSHQVWVSIFSTTFVWKSLILRRNETYKR